MQCTTVKLQNPYRNCNEWLQEQRQQQQVTTKDVFSVTFEIYAGLCFYDVQIHKAVNRYKLLSTLLV